MLGRIRQFVVDTVKRIAWRRLRPAGRSGDGQLTVVVQSFDGYKRFWRPIVFFTERAFAATSVDVVYASEHVAIVEDESRCRFTGEGDFISRFERAISSADSEYVFYVQEDHWITDELTDAQLNRYLSVMERHQLDVLKLGCESLWPDDHPMVVASTDPLPGDDGAEFGWFGPHRYSMGHHCSIFRREFLSAALRHARLFRITDPLQQELFTTRLFNESIKARNGDDGEVRIAIWRSTPSVAYVHACSWGRITPAGQATLDRFGVAELYDESIPGDVFPKPRYGD